MDIKRPFRPLQYESEKSVASQHLVASQFIEETSTNITGDLYGNGERHSSPFLLFDQTKGMETQEVIYTSTASSALERKESVMSRVRTQRLSRKTSGLLAEKDAVPQQPFPQNWQQNLSDAASFGLPFSERANIAREDQSPLLSARRTESLPFLDQPESRFRSGITNEMSYIPHIHWMPERHHRRFMSLSFFAIGFSAITALAIAIIGLLPLNIAAYVIVWPAIVLWIFIGILYPPYGKLALTGFLIGLIACFFYDSMRFIFIQLGLWGDFIPSIGMWLLHTNKPDALVGYLWRYIGDGGFMGMAFTVVYRALKPRLGVRLAALSYGLAIWLCLIATILIAPHGTQMLFALTPITFTLSLLGHIIYGLTIGLLYPIFIGPRSAMPLTGKMRAMRP